MRKWEEATTTRCILRARFDGFSWFCGNGLWPFLNRAGERAGGRVVVSTSVKWSLVMMLC